MRVLLDTCALAELRHPRCEPAVKATVARIAPDDLFLSVIVMGEISRGVALLREGRKKRALKTWLTVLTGQFGDRMLPVDYETAQVWGDICVSSRQTGVILSVVDGLLAATALRHGLYLMTRNSSRFAATGALVVDPWNETE